MAAAQQHAEAARSPTTSASRRCKNYTNVTAPIAGVVIWRYADTGALIQGGTNSNSQDLPIVRLSQSSLLRLRVPVPEDDVQYRPRRRPVAGARRCHQSLVHRQDRALHARCEFRNPHHGNRSGRGEQAISPSRPACTPTRRSQLGACKNVVTIPVEALVLNAQQQETVYVLDSSNRVHIRNVQVGLQGSKLAEITSGLDPGDRVIIGGQDKYQEGEEVSPHARLDARL